MAAKPIVMVNADVEINSGPWHNFSKVPLIYASVKLILTRKPHLMMKVWRFKVIIYSDETINRVCLLLNALGIHYIQESISFELKMGDETCRFVTLHKPLYQSHNQFESFSHNSE